MRLFIFGLGYTTSRLRDRLVAQGWQVSATTRDGRGGSIAFADEAAVRAALAGATHIISSVPPDGDTEPVLAAYGEDITRLGAGGAWLGYLSSTGVYGDTGGAWVDEDAPLAGRRGGRMAADQAWLTMGACVFRLPGIYGPGRSALDRVAEGKAYRVILPPGAPPQVFSRVHVDDIVSGVIAGMDAPAGAYNLADDRPCPQDEVTLFAARLLGMPAPPLVPLDSLSPMAQGFYAENRRVANGKARRVLGWRPIYADYRLGLRALSAITSPAIASTAPTPASSDQR